MKKRVKAWVQFYIVDENGREENFGKPRFLSLPEKTNTWKELLLISGNSDVDRVGWKTVKPIK